MMKPRRKRRARRLHKEVEYPRAVDEALAPVTNHALTLVARAKLFRRLSWIRVEFDFRKAEDATPSVKERAKPSRLLHGGIRKLAAFNADLAKVAGAAEAEIQELVELGGMWATRVTREEILERVPGVRAVLKPDGTITHDIGADLMVRQLLQMAAIVGEWLDEVPTEARERQRSAAVWLLGVALPELYERTFQRKFTVGHDGSPSEAVEFVLAAAGAIWAAKKDGETWSANTVASYRKRATEQR